MSPAPTITTWRGSPTTVRAASTATVATDACPDEIDVSVRTRLPVASAARNSRFVVGPVVCAASALSYARLTWPWISASPTTIESSPETTR